MSADRLAEFTKCNLLTTTRTRRGRNNVHYRERALEVIGYGEDPRFFWLFDPVAIDAGRTKATRFSVLAELGRIPDKADLMATALQICEIRPTCHKAISMIRRARLGASPKARPLDEEIAQLVNSYMARHPDTDWSIVLQALSAVAASINDRVEANG